MRKIGILLSEIARNVKKLKPQKSCNLFSIRILLYVLVDKLRILVAKIHLQN